MRRATFKTASSKVVKHEKACFDNQQTFIRFVIDTFDFLVSEIMNLLQRVKRLMHNNVSLNLIDVLCKRIDFSIQYKIMMRFDNRLSYIYIIFIMYMSI